MVRGGSIGSRLKMKRGKKKTGKRGKHWITTCVIYPNRGCRVEKLRLYTMGGETRAHPGLQTALIFPWKWEWPKQCGQKSKPRLAAPVVQLLPDCQCRIPDPERQRLGPNAEGPDGIRVLIWAQSQFPSRWPSHDSQPYTKSKQINQQMLLLAKVLFKWINRRKQ